jgi:hypothetical protein
VADRVAWLVGRRECADEAVPQDELPLPPPAQRSGAMIFLLRHELATALMLLNPFQLAQVLRQVRGEAAARSRFFGQLSDQASYQSRCRVGQYTPMSLRSAAGRWTH